MPDRTDLRRSNSSKDPERKPSSMLLGRALSTRSNKVGSNGPCRYDFSLSSIRGTIQPELSKKLYKMIKTENRLISGYETVSRERLCVAAQLSDWGDCTKDDAISDISSKIGILLSELGDLERLYAKNLNKSRGILKVIRDTEKSVQPSRDAKAKVLDDIFKLKAKEPESMKLITYEQEFIRAEAENLVAEAQLTNITRTNLKQAYAAEFTATIEYAEKQIIIARHGFRLLSLLDDSPVLPGDTHHAFRYAGQARQILNDAEDDLKDWKPDDLGDYFPPDWNLSNNLNPFHSHRRDQTLESTSVVDDESHKSHDNGSHRVNTRSKRATDSQVSSWTAKDE
ncbi:Sphingolipid long chain base-responsive protein LSP1 [Golovinomyces cichoracearum]|uniref:Sphingolipid long chain base-responsive protein LSP1 n=1 Tax=Golovinomyces cichoracearum TaxID=62708 RepID=A0A420HDT0_9PEZI|nr:Sphingolipid long chain base-responsive protein LSP1 [Golovinomyces cichoracearum]